MDIRRIIRCSSCGRKLGIYCGGDLKLEIKCYRCKAHLIRAHRKMEAPETQGKRTVFMILVSSCVFFVCC